MSGLLNDLIIETRLALKRFLSGRRFSNIKGPNFAIRRGAPGSLMYEESGESFLVNTADGEGSYIVQIENMGAVDLKLDVLPVAEKLRIARNIRDALLRKGVNAEVLYEHRPVRD